MGHKEREIINEVLKEGTKKGRMFRVNCGMAWAGRLRSKGNDFITLSNPRPFHGMPAGTPDCIGWECKTLCELIKQRNDNFPCMQEGLNNNEDCKFCDLNKKIAVFKAVEIKTGNQKLSELQENWKQQVLKDGGIYEERRH